MIAMVKALCALPSTLPGTARAGVRRTICQASRVQVSNPSFKRRPWHRPPLRSIPDTRSEQDCPLEHYDYIWSLMVTRVTADEGAANLITLSVSTMTSSIRIKTGHR
jgi:hypothetical protein